MAEKRKVGIYLIDSSIEEFEEKTSSEIVLTIVNDHNEGKIRKERLKKEFDVPKEIDEFHVQLFHSEKKTNPDWIEFLNKITEEGETLSFDDAQNIINSFVCFIYNDDFIFAITGGLGNFAVQDFADMTFGIQILERLIQKNDTAIRYLQERGLIGNTLGASRFFRTDLSLYDEDSFGKIYKEVGAILEKNILVGSLGFSNQEIDAGKSCTAKSSFTINKNLDFDQTIQLIHKFKELLTEKANFAVNSVRLIQNRGKNNKALLVKLQKKLYDVLWDVFTNTQEPNLEFCHKEFQKFFEADHLKIITGNSDIEFDGDRRNFKEVVDFINRENIVNLANKSIFIKTLSRLKIVTTDDSAHEVTKGGIIKHINCEIELEDKPYFYIDENWYSIESGFLDNINNTLNAIFANKRDDNILEERMDISLSEDIYNQKYIGKQDHHVFHKVLVNNIELCDILKIDGDKMYFIHVKKGFDHTVRDLCSQIEIAAKRIYEDVKTGNYNNIKLLRTSALNKNDVHDPTSYFSQVANQAAVQEQEEEFVDLFRNTEKIFVFAVVDTAINERNFDDFELFKSNIAKISLFNLNNVIKGIDMTLKICQIRKI